MLKFWYLTLFAFIFSMIANYLALLGPMYLGNAMNAISNKTGVLIDEVIYNFWQMLFCYITSFVLSYLLTIIMVILSQKITYLMRKQLFEKLTILPIAYLIRIQLEILLAEFPMILIQLMQLYQLI